MENSTASNTEKSKKVLNNWDGYSKKGETVYEAIFEDEKRQSAKMDCLNGICECCNTSMYYGL
jgi:hypothetical protein